jgi:DNA-binding NarL/FixJ family response regulator
VSRRVRVVIADDHPMFRFGLAAALAESGDVLVVGEASSGQQLLDVATATSPDVVITDLHMPGLDGVSATSELLSRRPDLAVLVVTMLDDDESIFAALRAGARGYLVKGATGTQIIAAVQALGRGETVYGGAVARRITDFFLAGTQGYAGRVFPELTPRERDVLDLVAAGRNNVAIGRALGLSDKTVRNHLASVLTKLQAHDRAEVIVKARQAGLGRRRAEAGQ